MRIQESAVRMHVFIPSMQISCIFCFTTGTQIKMTLINVTGFALRVNLGLGKDIDPVDCIFFSLIKSYIKMCIPCPSPGTTCQELKPVFLGCTSGSSAFFSGINAKRKREKVNS